jgi:predicted RNA-binding Zn ribbon-like protein
MSIQAGWVFDRCGGHVAIDFANTVSARHTEAPIERLTGYTALVSFAEQSGLIETERAARLKAWASGAPAEAQRVLEGAIGLREALYELFAAAAAKRPPAAEALATFNGWWRRLRLDDAFEWQWSDGHDAPDAFLAPVVSAAVELLTSTVRDRVRICDAEDCVWLFLDTSKNRSRRWCDMNQCGNRAKARRFYRRTTDESRGRSD